MRRRCAKCYCDKTEELVSIGSTEKCVQCKDVLENNFVAVNVDVYLVAIRDFLLEQCKGNARSGLKSTFICSLSRFSPSFGHTKGSLHATRVITRVNTYVGY
jgi:hypothetical protein